MNNKYLFGRPTIGVLAGWQFYRTATNLSYLDPIYRGINKAAKDYDCNVMLGCGMGPSASPSDPIKTAWPTFQSDHDFIPIGDWNTDGLIVAVPLHSEERSAYIQNVLKQKHPVLFIGSGEDGPSIVADNTGGIQNAMQHLYQHGHKAIAFIAGSKDDIRGDSGERLRAFHQFCEENKLKRDPCLIAYSQHIYSGGYQAMKQILASGCEFSAVMASNDESALGAMAALTDSGLRVPEDVAIIGFDNRLEGAIQEPGLTSVHVPLYDIGYRSVEMILQKIEEKPDIPDILKIETQLVVRQSCGCKVEDLDSVRISENDNNFIVDIDEKISHLDEAIARNIMKEAQNLTEDKSHSFAKQLVDAYRYSLKSNKPEDFLDVLEEILQKTEESGDVVHLWQKAISLLEVEFDTNRISSFDFSKKIVDKARNAISAHMQQQYRRHVMRERWTSSRLSLLTAELITALNQDQIYTILKKHLPELNISTAMLAMFRGNDEESNLSVKIQNVMNPGSQSIQFKVEKFPPQRILDDDQPFYFTLIPVVDQEGQLGFMVFDTDHLDLYGSIVQQLGSSLNTIRLYRQATEGRQLAEEANKMKSNFLSMISHELRTPLNLIVGLSGIILQEGEEQQSLASSSTNQDIKRIQTYAQHLSSLIGDVIDLATMDAGQLRLNKELVDLGEALQMVNESGRQLAADKGLSWISNLPKSGPWVWGDRTRLRQIVLNLVNNAIKFTSRGEVELSVTAIGDQVEISVRDTGLGIPKEEQNVIFDAFRRSEKSVNFGFPGLGLGLTICKLLVEMHGGTIELSSSGKEGEGTIFHLRLPSVQAKKIDQNYVFEQPEKKYASILVLSTRPGSNQKLTNRLLQRKIKVREARIGDLQDWQPKPGNSFEDMIIVDVTVQSDLTWKTLKTIKENYLTREVPTMLYSYTEENESLMRLDYLTKPIEFDELTWALDQYWDKIDPADQTRSVLVVDDDLNTLELHSRIVQSQSSANRVFQAKNGSKALKLLNQQRIDLVLLDLQMPEMDGFEVLRKMRESERTRNIPVIVITGKVLTDQDMNRLNLGVSVVLQKGLFSIEETLEHIENTLEKNHKLGSDTQNLVRQAMAFIHEHYFDTITRLDIAKHINISEDYLTYCFRQELKTTPIKYLQRYRINQAKTLLRNSHKNITEVAVEVGFSDSGYFSRIFSREVGISPDQYRRS